MHFNYVMCSFLNKLASVSWLIEVYFFRKSYLVQDQLNI